MPVILLCDHGLWAQYGGRWWWSEPRFMIGARYFTVVMWILGLCCGSAGLFFHWLDAALKTTNDKPE